MSASDVARETATVAVKGLRPAIEALEDIALLPESCPLAAAIAARGLRAVRSEMAAAFNPEVYAQRVFTDTTAATREASA